MRIQFDNTDSEGRPVTSSITIEIGGERHTVEPATTGSANPPKRVAKELIARGIAREYDDGDEEEEEESSDGE